MNQLEKEQKLISEYDLLKPLLINWGKQVDEIILELLQNDTNFQIQSLQIPPKHRIKMDNSLIRNALYGKLDSTDPLLRIEDKVGTRIVVTSLRDVEKVKAIIEKNTTYWQFRISRNLEKSLDKPKEFDYNALHINLIPSENVKGFETFSKKTRSYYVCELQVRTLLQHAYAEVAHDTIYKGPYSENGKLVRLMSKAEALMEVTDEYFCNVYDTMEKIEEYEISFINRLEKMAITEFGYKFSRKDIDSTLTNEIFEIFEIKKINIEEVERVLISNKSEIIKLLSNMKSYLSKQPILLFLAYLTITDRFSLKEKWHLDELILKEIFMRMNYAFGK
jgi:putative GTP pyrophosphokinase